MLITNIQFLVCFLYLQDIAIHVYYPTTLPITLSNYMSFTVEWYKWVYQKQLWKIYHKVITKSVFYSVVLSGITWSQFHELCSFHYIFNSKIVIFLSPICLHLYNAQCIAFETTSPCLCGSHQHLVLKFCSYFRPALPVNINKCYLYFTCGLDWPVLGTGSSLLDLRYRN